MVVGRHQQQRHEVLEHRAAPGNENRLAACAREQPPQRKPALLRQASLRDRDERGQSRLGSQQVVVARIAPPLGDVVTYRQQLTARIVQEVVFDFGKCVCLECQPFERGNPVSGALACQRDEFPKFARFDFRRQFRFKARELAQRRDLIDAGESSGSVAGGRRRCPGSEKPQIVEGIPALALERACPPAGLALGGGVQARGDRGGGLREVLEPQRRRGKGGRPGIVCRFQVFPQLDEPVRRSSGHGLYENRQRVAQALEQSRPDDPAVGDGEKSRPQGQQVPCQVAAVHGRDVGRQQRLERPGVVPVVEVAPVPLQRAHRGQRIGRALDQSAGRNVAEVVRRQIREQRKPHVGRRGAVCHPGGGLLLIIVGRQPMIFRADECLEERPRPACTFPQEDGLAGRQAGCAVSERPAHPPRNNRGEQPQAQDRPGHEQRGRPCHRQMDQRGAGNRHGDPHRAAEAGEVRAAVRFAGGRPLQQPGSGDEHPPRRAHDGIEAEAGLVGETDERECNLGEAPAGRVRRGGEMLAEQHIARLEKQLERRGKQRWNRDDPDHGQGPEPRRRQHRPAQQQQQRQARRHQAAPQVVEELPSGKARERVALTAPARARNTRQQPARKLPIPADPAVPPGHVRGVAVGIFLVQMHIAQQARTRIAAFEKIVAQDPVLRKAPAHRPFERIDIVDALADERAFAKQVLVHIRDGTRIRIDARLGSAHARIARAVRAGQARGHAWLQDAVALRYELPRLVVARAIQRVRHGPDELPCRVARQLRIGVERDHVFHVRQDGRLAHHEREAIADATIAWGAAQQSIQVGKLAALALVAHPDRFLRIPSARAMKQEEAIPPRARVPGVQPLDAPARQPQERPVVRERFRRRVTKIRQQAEVQVVVPVRQEPDFQRLDQAFDALRAGQHGRNHHQSARFRRNPSGEIQSRQQVRRHQQRRPPVHQRHRQLACAQQRGDADQAERPILHAADMGLLQQARGDDRRNQGDRAEIELQGEPAA